VNVAARLEALAEPSGICISRMVHDQVRDRLRFAFEDLGGQQVKNIARPVGVYRVLWDDAASAALDVSRMPPLELPEKTSSCRSTI
jgi:adenylate cyclase